MTCFLASNPLSGFRSSSIKFKKRAIDNSTFLEEKCSLFKLCFHKYKTSEVKCRSVNIMHLAGNDMLACVQLLYSESISCDHFSTGVQSTFTMLCMVVKSRSSLNILYIKKEKKGKVRQPGFVRALTTT